MIVFKFKSKNWFDITIEAPNEKEAIKSYNQFKKKGNKLDVKE
jgi:hypothetical protein